MVNYQESQLYCNVYECWTAYNILRGKMFRFENLFVPIFIYSVNSTKALLSLKENLSSKGEPELQVLFHWYSYADQYFLAEMSILGPPLCNSHLTTFQGSC